MSFAPAKPSSERGSERDDFVRNPSVDPQFDERLARLLVACGAKNDSELARILNIKPQSITSARRRKQFPPAWVEEIALKYDVSSDWLFFGKGAMRRNEDSRATKEGDPDLVMVPKVRARLSAGGGSLETSAEVKARYAFRREWIRAKGQPAKMVLMDVAGDSMEPDIRDKDVVLIDQSQADVIAGAVYAVGIDDAVLIKYLDKEPGKLILRSANERYRSIEVDMKDESQNVRIIGRVVWWCREAR